MRAIWCNIEEGADQDTGIGVMGFPMAVNLRSKIDKSTKIIICDVSPEQIEKYKSTIRGQGEVDVVANGAEAARQAVSTEEESLACWN